jgi:hypothetical protein
MTHPSLFATLRIYKGRYATKQTKTREVKATASKLVEDRKCGFQQFLSTSSNIVETGPADRACLAALGMRQLAVAC